MWTPDLHYHICWSSKATLDWQRFGTREQAKAEAAHLVLPGESFTIEQCSEDCLGRLLRAQLKKVRLTAHVRDPLLANLPKEALEALARAYDDVLTKYALSGQDASQDRPQNQIESNRAIVAALPEARHE